MKYPHVQTELETVIAAGAGVSLARFGDGELKLAMGSAAKSQRADHMLASILRKILGEKAAGPCLPCIPRWIPDGPKAKFWKNYTREPWVALYRQGKSYGSSLVTRPDSAPEIDTPSYWEHMRALWRGRDVVLVAGSEKSLTTGLMPEAARVDHIIVPPANAWDHRRALFNRLRVERERRVILCCGATATALAWMLAQEGVHALDLGHVGMFLKRVGPDGRLGPSRRTEKDIVPGFP